MVLTGYIYGYFVIFYNISFIFGKLMILKETFRKVNDNCILLFKNFPVKFS